MRQPSQDKGLRPPLTNDRTKDRSEYPRTPFSRGGRKFQGSPAGAPQRRASMSSREKYTACTIVSDGGRAGRSSTWATVTVRPSHGGRWWIASATLRMSPRPCSPGPRGVSVTRRCARFSSSSFCTPQRLLFFGRSSSSSLRPLRLEPDPRARAVDEAAGADSFPPASSQTTNESRPARTEDLVHACDG